MKKLLTLFLILILAFPAIASAELPDISQLTFDELVALKDQINLALWNSQEWQEVRVPVGIWKVGEDIPEGHWLITPKEKDFGQVFYCEKVDFDTKKPDHSGKSHTIVIASKSHGFGDSTVNEVDYDMRAGWYFINEVPVTFTPYTGKPDLGFK